MHFEDHINHKQTRVIGIDPTYAIHSCFYIALVNLRKLTYYVLVLTEMAVLTELTVLHVGIYSDKIQIILL